MRDWKTIAVPELIRKLSPSTHAYQRDVMDGHLSVFVAREPDGWHLSISHRINVYPFPPGRYPTWDEIADARYRFCPDDVTMAMLLPPPSEYVNIHETTFHLWEVPAIKGVSK